MVGKRRDKKWPIGEVFRHGIEDGSIERMGALARESFDKLSDEQVAKLMLLIDGIMDDVEAGGPMSFLMMFAGAYIQQEGKRRFCGDKS